MDIKTLLHGLHAEVSPTRLLPPAAAVRIFLPLARANDPGRSESADLFMSWVLKRDQAISVNQVAFLWENFRTQFGQEVPTLWRAWFASPDKSGLTSPLGLAKIEARIFLMTVFKPWAAQMRRTLAGRILLKVLATSVAAVALVCLFVLCWVLGAAATELARLALQALS